MSNRISCWVSSLNCVSGLPVRANVSGSSLTFAYQMSTKSMGGLNFQLLGNIFWGGYRYRSQTRIRDVIGEPKRMKIVSATIKNTNDALSAKANCSKGLSLLPSLPIKIHLKTTAKNQSLDDLWHWLVLSLNTVAHIRTKTHSWRPDQFPRLYFVVLHAKSWKRSKDLANENETGWITTSTFARLSTMTKISRISKSSKEQCNIQSTN